jgi:hypothetical protein
MIDPKTYNLLTDLSSRTTKAQHQALDELTFQLGAYRTSLRMSPDHGASRVETLKNVQSLTGLLACADGRQTAIRDIRNASKPTVQELDDQRTAEEREGLVNDVLAAADTIVDLGLLPVGAEARDAVTALEVSVHDLFKFDEEIDESDDDDDQDSTILPPAMTIYERKELEAFFRNLGI